MYVIVALLLLFAYPLSKSVVIKNGEILEKRRQERLSKENK